MNLEQSLIAEIMNQANAERRSVGEITEHLYREYLRRQDTKGENLERILDLPEEGLNLTAVVSNLEKRLIQQALERTGGNRGAAARLLKLNRTTLVEKLRRFKVLWP